MPLGERSQPLARLLSVLEHCMLFEFVFQFEALVCLALVVAHFLREFCLFRPRACAKRVVIAWATHGYLQACPTSLSRCRWARLRLKWSVSVFYVAACSWIVAACGDAPRRGRYACIGL